MLGLSARCRWPGWSASRRCLVLARGGNAVAAPASRVSADLFRMIVAPPSVSACGAERSPVERTLCHQLAARARALGPQVANHTGGAPRRGRIAAGTPGRRDRAQPTARQLRPVRRQESGRASVRSETAQRPPPVAAARGPAGVTGHAAASACEDAGHEVGRDRPSAVEDRRSPRRPGTTRTGLPCARASPTSFARIGLPRRACPASCSDGAASGPGIPQQRIGDQDIGVGGRMRCPRSRPVPVACHANRPSGRSRCARVQDQIVRTVSGRSAISAISICGPALAHDVATLVVPDHPAVARHVGDR